MNMPFLTDDTVLRSSLLSICLVLVIWTVMPKLGAFTLTVLTDQAPFVLRPTGFVAFKTDVNKAVASAPSRLFLGVKTSGNAYQILCVCR